MKKILVTLALGATAAACSAGAEAPPPLPAGAIIAEVKVLKDRYEPAEVRGKAGSPLRLLVTRTTDGGCGQQLSIPSMSVTKDLPLGQPVAVDLTLPAAGKVAFTCGMGHFEGTIVVD